MLADGTPCVMKVQYPGVARSIQSDVNNLSTLMNLTNILPPGMYLDKALSVLSKVKRKTFVVIWIGFVSFPIGRNWLLNVIM